MSIIGALGRTGVSLWVAVVLVKALMAAATAGCALIIYRLVKEVRPDAALLASMAYWWNPTVLIEAAGEGHNDPLMALLMLLTIWCTMRQRFMAGALALTAGALIKYVPVLFAPALAVYQWRSTADRRLLASKMVATAACCVVITTVAFVPFWAGWSTFDGVQESARLKFTNGTSGVTFWGMSQLMGSTNATYLTRIVLGAALLILVLHASWAVRDDQTLLAACTTISMFYVLVVTPRFWPWYVMLPTALLCASGRRPDIAVAFALTACARAVAPLDVIRFSNAISWPVQVWATTIVGVWVPALVWIAVSWVSVRRASVAPEPRRRARRWFSDEVTG
jgi:Gpi18-like mannosyltransferase